MSSSLLVMEAANLYAGDVNPNDSNHLTLNGLKLPDMEEGYVDHMAGGARVGIEIDTGVNKLQAGFNLAGWSPQVMTLFGRWSSQAQKFTAYGVIRDRMTGTANAAVGVMWGRLGKATPTEFKRGELQGFEYAIRAIQHYELTLDGYGQLYYWDFFTNTFIVGGVDVNADTNTILGISSTYVPPNGVEQSNTVTQSVDTAASAATAGA